MATLYKKPNSPNWYAQYFDESGHRVSRSTGTTKKRDAERIAADLDAKARDLRDGKPGMPSAFSALVEAAAREAQAGELTLARTEDLIRRLHQLANPDFRVVSLSDHLSAWVKAQENHVEKHTTRIYLDMHRRITQMVGPRIAAAPVGDLTKEAVEKALVKITKSKVKGTDRTITAATANMDLRALRRALQIAVETGMAKSNVAESVRPLPQSDSYERAEFTRAEVRQMIDHKDTSEEWRGAILLAAYTGLRLGDVVRLNRSHVVNDRLVIRPAKTKNTLKTLKIPLTPPCFAWIGDKQGDFFPSLIGGKPGTLSTTFSRIMKRAGVPREITEAGDVVKRRSFHSLRHSFASWLAEADVHADVRQKLTGHSSAGIHAKYSHHDAALDRAVGSLQDL